MDVCLKAVTIIISNPFMARKLWNMTTVSDFNTPSTLRKLKSKYESKMQKKPKSKSKLCRTKGSSQAARAQNQTLKKTTSASD